MSHLALTAAFGSSARYHPGPKHVRVFGQLLVGGSGVYLFNNLMTAGSTVRLRADESGLADALMAGFAVAEPGLELGGRAGSLANAFRSGGASSCDVELGFEDAALLAAAVADTDIALLLTLNESDDSVRVHDFRGWTVTIARSVS